MIEYVYTGDYNDKEPYASALPPNPETKSNPTNENAPIQGTAELTAPTNAHTWALPLNLVKRLALSDRGTLFQGSTDSIPPLEEAKHAGVYVINSKVYILAEKYDIPNLRKLAFEKYKNYLSKEDWEDFIESLRLICEKTTEQDQDLRCLAYERARQNLEILLVFTDFVKLLDDHGRLGRELMQRAVYRNKPQFAIFCSKCNLPIFCPGCTSVGFFCYLNIEDPLFAENDGGELACYNKDCDLTFSFKDVVQKCSGCRAENCMVRGSFSRGFGIVRYGQLKYQLP